MLNDHFESAGDLIDKHGISRRLRALDAIQLAVALHVRLTVPVDYFVCADQDLCTVASYEGQAVINPLSPWLCRIRWNATGTPLVYPARPQVATKQQKRRQY
jgi:hypothetical protein